MIATLGALAPVALVIALGWGLRRARFPGERAITTDTALRLGLFFGMEEQFWLNLQTHYDLEVARTEAGERLKAEVVPHAA